MVINFYTKPDQLAATVTLHNHSIPRVGELLAIRMPVEQLETGTTFIVYDVQYEFYAEVLEPCVSCILTTSAKQARKKILKNNGWVQPSNK